MQIHASLTLWPLTFPVEPLFDPRNTLPVWVYDQQESPSTGPCPGRESFAVSQADDPITTSHSRVWIEGP